VTGGAAAVVGLYHRRLISLFVGICCNVQRKSPHLFVSATHMPEQVKALLEGRLLRRHAWLEPDGAAQKSGPAQGQAVKAFEAALEGLYGCIVRHPQSAAAGANAAEDLREFQAQLAEPAVAACVEEMAKQLMARIRRRGRRAPVRAVLARVRACVRACACVCEYEYVLLTRKLCVPIQQRNGQQSKSNGQAACSGACA